jgi:TPR repeat protein
LLLVFARAPLILTSMDQLPWYRRLFAGPRETDLTTTLAKAGRGDADAQFGLGLKYSLGEGLAQDLAQAAQWYEKAADQNHSLAQFNLSVMFASGQGVPRNEATALIWTRKAAEGGDAGAQFNLGTRYHRASVDRLQMDSAESRVEAYKWFHLAAAQGYKGSDAACERVALGMTREEVADGQLRTAAFVARKSAEPKNDSCRTTTE